MKKRLFDLLISFGFVKTTKIKNFHIFKNKNEILAFPKKLQLYHLYYARKHLDMNGWICENDFNKMFNL